MNKFDKISDDCDLELAMIDVDRRGARLEKYGDEFLKLVGLAVLGGLSPQKFYNASQPLIGGLQKFISDYNKNVFCDWGEEVDDFIDFLTEFEIANFNEDKRTFKLNPIKKWGI